MSLKTLLPATLAACSFVLVVFASEGTAKFSFEDITSASGVHFVGENGSTPDKHMIETMGSGVGLLDYNGDGRLDILFVNGGGRPGSPEASHNRLALYANLGNDKFEDRTAAAGLTGSFDTYGMGVAVADYDNDGLPDFVLTGYPRTLLFHNNGDGTFSNVTVVAGVANQGRWATSAGWLDYDRDGLLDLAIANYVGNFSWEDQRFCGDAAKGQRAYCHPDVYEGAGVRLYHNEGNGRFRDTTRQAGLESTEGKCLGLVLADFDGDGWMDMFVANDSVMNFYYRNGGNGKFTETGLASGVGFNDDGQAEAGMGVDAAFVAGGNHPDLYVTHLDNEFNRYYRNTGNHRFRDSTMESGLGAERSMFSGFGVRFADFNNRGRQQILVANGHILDNIALFHPRVSYREPLLLLDSTEKGQFRDVSQQSGEMFSKPLLGRGLAVGDLDNDGLLDFVVSQNFGPPLIAHNRTSGGNWVTLTLQGAGKSNRDAIGAEVSLRAGGKLQRAQITGGGSYCSASDKRLHFGLDRAQKVDQLEIKWPSGRVETLRDLAANKTHHIAEHAVQ